MRTLDKKLLRNLGSMKGQVVAIVLIIACGVASYVTMVTAYRGLTGSRDGYFARYRMAHVFAPVKRAPRSTLRRLEAVDGVRRVEGRIVFEVTIDMPTIVQPCSGRVISVPDKRVAIINDLHLTSGGWFTGDGTRQTIVADNFARVHGLRTGDTITVLMNNRKQALRIVGTALSPEYVYLIRGAGDILPDHERFTVLWTSETFAESVFDYEEAMNDVVATLDRDADVDEVIATFDQVLDRHGAIGAYAQKDHLPSRYLNDEIEGLETSSTVVPMIFLGIAAFVLHVLMGRVVRAQRTQISIFRAFGYTTGAVAAHYLKFALFVGALGALLGAGLGVWLAWAMVDAYRAFFDLPVLVFAPDAVAVIGGALVSLAFSAFGAFQAVWAVARLDPAEGLRPEAPSDYGRTLFERIGPVWRHLGFAPRMVLRHVARTPLRALVTIGGVAFATAIVVFTTYIYDAWDALIDVQFRLIERQDARVVFHEDRGRAALYEIRHVPGVLAAEPELIVPVEIVNGRHSRRTGVYGLLPDTTLHPPLDEDLARIDLNVPGLLLSRKLADLLDVVPGSTVEVRVLIGRKPVLQLPVASVVDEYLGSFAYADINALSRWLGESFAMSSVLVKTDPRKNERLGVTLKNLPAVAAVTFKDRTVKTFRDTAEESQQISNYVLLCFAGVIAFGVLYNTARISLAERSRELGSLRVLGFTHAEVGAVLAGESLFLTVLGIVPGVALGVWFSWFLSHAYETDLYRFPFVMRGSNILTSIVVVLVFGVIANVLVLRRLRRQNVVEVLKTRE